jgi:D-aspartate ligase
VARSNASGRLACVAGGVELVRALAAAGVRSVLTSPREDTAAGSRFVAEHVPIDPPPLTEALVERARGGRRPLPLLYDSDEAVLAISRARDALAASYRFLLPGADLVEDLVDKARFQALAERLSLPVPAAAHVRPARSGPEDLALPFPLVMKAVPFRDDRWRAIGEAAKVLYVRDEAELRRVWPRLAEADLDLLAQEVVPGGERDLLSYHVSVDASGAVAGEFTGRKIRTHPAEFGMSASLVTTIDPHVTAVGRDLVERLGLRGPAKLDFKRGPDGELHLLEVNPRFTLWVQPGAVAGVNLPAIAYADLMGEPRPPVATARAGVRWLSPRSDFLAAREEHLPMHRWLWFAVRSEAITSFAWNDFGPLRRRGGVALARHRARLRG